MSNGLLVLCLIQERNNIDRETYRKQIHEIIVNSKHNKENHLPPKYYPFGHYTPWTSSRQYKRVKTLRDEADSLDRIIRFTLAPRTRPPWWNPARKYFPLEPLYGSEERRTRVSSNLEQFVVDKFKNFSAYLVDKNQNRTFAPGPLQIKTSSRPAKVEVFPGWKILTNVISI